MKKIWISTLALVLAVGFSFSVLAADAKDVLGLWATVPSERGIAHVKISEKGGKYFGEIVWLEQPLYPASEGPEWSGKTKTDRNNPDKTKRKGTILGLQIVKDMNYRGDHFWDGGTIYDPENGKTYKSKMTFKGNELDIRGYIGFSLLGRTSTWTRVKETQPAVEKHATEEAQPVKEEHPQ